MSDFRLDTTPRPALAPKPAAATPAAAPAPAHDKLAAPAIPAAQLAAYQAQGLLPPDFGSAPAWDQQRMWWGAQKIEATPFFGPLRQNLQVGDVVLCHGNDTFITPMDGGARYVHTAIVSKTEPLTMIEAWGPNDSGQASVREVPFAEFVAGTGADGYKVIRPTSDPARARAAVDFARQQVGKPYNWSFNLVGPVGDTSWFCSSLTYAAYGTGPGPNLLNVKKDPRRDRTLAFIRDLAAGLRLQDPAKVTRLVNLAYGSPLLGNHHHTVQEVLDYACHDMLAQDPVFKPVMKTPAGKQLVQDASQDMLQSFTHGKPVDAKAALWDRFKALGWRDKLSVGWALARGAIHLHPASLLKLRGDLQHGDVVKEMVSPQDLADAPAAASWKYGAAS